MKVLVLTISDRAFQGIYEDTSGPAIEQVLLSSIKDVQIQRHVVADDIQAIENKLVTYSDDPEKAVGLIITTGGTGIGPRDFTPDVTQNCCHKMIPGISEYLRMESCKETHFAVLSRAVAGMRKNTLIINVPGSVKGATSCTKLIIPLLDHAFHMIQGHSH